MRVAMLLHKSVEFDSRVRREASALVAAGHTVFVLELTAVPERAPHLDGFERISVLPSPVLKRLLPFHLYRLACLLAFVRATIRLRPDVVHAHDAAMLVPGAAGALLTRAGLIYDSHELATGVPYRERGWTLLVAAIERAIVPRCAAVITVSDGIAERLRDRYRLLVTPTVVRNVSALRAGGEGGLRRRLGIEGARPLVLHQGAPAPDRGCEVLVDAVAELGGDVMLAFLGDPDPGYGEQLQAHIDGRGLGARVTLLPSVPLAALLTHTAEADVGVTLLQDTCENHRLALPNKLFEYVAAGIPVVAAALPEAQRLVERYGIGWCADPADSTAVAAALQSALAAGDDTALRERLHAAAAELNWEVEQDRLIDLYARLVAAKRPPDATLVVLQLVRNGVTHDARVQRASGTAQRLGANAVVIGVRTDATPAGEASINGARVIRLAPWGRLSRRRIRAQPSSIPAPAGAVASSSAVTAIPKLSRSARLRRVAAGGAFAIQAVAIARRLRPTVVHANDWNTMWAAIVISRISRAALIYDSHELWADRNGRWENRRWLIAAEALFVRTAGDVLVTSPGHGEALAARYRIASPQVIRNIPHQHRNASVTDPPPARSVIAYVGGLMPGRGLEQAIDALPELPGVALRAIGPSGTGYRQSLLDRATAAGVADRVEFPGAVAPEEIEQSLHGALAGLCLIQPICRSYELCLPNKLFEYVAAGLPVVASELPVIASVVAGNGLGIVVQSRDPTAIAAAVTALRDRRVRDGIVAAASQFAARNDSERELELLADVYRRALVRLQVNAERGHQSRNRR